MDDFLRDIPPSLETPSYAMGNVAPSPSPPAAEVGAAAPARPFFTVDEVRRDSVGVGGRGEKQRQESTTDPAARPLLHSKTKNSPTPPESSPPSRRRETAAEAR